MARRIESARPQVRRRTRPARACIFGSSSLLSSCRPTTSANAKGQRRLRDDIQTGPGVLQGLRSILPPAGTGRLQWEFRADEQEIREPLKLAYLFAEKRTGRPVTRSLIVNSKDVETAKQLLAEITIRAKRRHSLTTPWPRPRRPSSTYRPWEVSGSTSPDSKPGRRPKQLRRNGKPLERDRENQRLAYGDYRRKKLVAVFESLPPSEQEEIESLARAGAARFGGSPDGADVHRDKVPSPVRTLRRTNRHFDAWKAAA